MPRPQHYSPAIQRFLVSVLYHEARSKKIPMTKLTNQILEDRLKGSTGWMIAQETHTNAGTTAYIMTDK
jgi:hypothetical protein